MEITPAVNMPLVLASETSISLNDSNNDLNNDLNNDSNNDLNINLINFNNNNSFASNLDTTIDNCMPDILHAYTGESPSSGADPVIFLTGFSSRIFICLISTRIPLHALYKTHMHKRTCTNTHKYTYAHTNTQTQIHTHTLTYTRARAHPEYT